jgi:putative colanic acid biosynthesis UDP-glucose lipid carrier transferase
MDIQDRHTFSKLSLGALDVLSTYLAAILATRFYFAVDLDDLPSNYHTLILCCTILVATVYSKQDVYESWRGRSMPKILALLVISWGSVLLVATVLVFFLHRAEDLSRRWLVVWFLFAAFLLVTYRTAVYFALRLLRRHFSINQKRVVLVGYGAVGREIHARAISQVWFGYKVVAAYAQKEDITDLIRQNVHVIEDMHNIHQYVREESIDEVWIALPMKKCYRLHSLIRLLRNTFADVRFIPDTLSIEILTSKFDQFLGIPAVFLNRPRYGGIAGFGKTMVDKIFALAGLIALLPLFVVVATLIKATSPGPVFYRQERHGLNGKVFRIYKFRSMKMSSEPAPESGYPKQATRDDPRVTRLGAFLRRTSLDELPQLLNVLRGEMSIVGPRPHAVQHNEKYEALLDLYMLRHRMKPGITGWAQINGLRGETDTIEKMAERVKFDLDYLQNWSLFLDLKIILWTAFRGWTGSHVY